MTLPTTSNPGNPHDHSAEVVALARKLKKKAHLRKLKTARALAGRIQVAADGTRTFLRFNQSQRFEHQVLMVSFTLLTVSGILQLFSRYFVVGLIISAFGGMDTIRTLHHMAALILILQSIFHTWKILDLWFVKRERGGMWPYFKDLRDLFQMVAYNIGLAKFRPKFDRYSAEEKLEYWALLWGTPLMIITGLIMWFPIQATWLLPGDAIPVSRALHGWEAILAALAILTWHMYHTVIKERNKSIFTGTMTETEMEHGHPIEHRRILAAAEYLQKVTSQQKISKNGKPDSHSKTALKKTAVPEH